VVLEDQRLRTRVNEVAAERRRLGRFDAPRLLPSSLSLLFGVVALAGAIGSYWVARETALFEIRRIEIVGAQKAVGARVSAALRPLEGESLVDLERSDLDRRIAGLSDVVGVTHDRAFPHTLRVFVRSERPLLVLRRGDESWLVSERARVVRPLAKGTRAALPRVWVPRTVDVEVGDTIADTTARAAVRVLLLARVELSGRVRAVRIERGEAALILRSGVEVRLGRGHDLPLKLAVAAVVLPELTPDTGYLDVAVPSRPVAGSQS
jgi:cell division septal protein FtsQ